MKTFRTCLLIAGILVAAVALNTAVAQEAYPGKEKAKSYKEISKSNKESLKAELKQKRYPMEKSKVGKHRIKKEHKQSVKAKLQSQKPVHKRKEIYGSSKSL
jgi:hypothetical protein